MLQKSIRTCDHCHSAIEPETNYLSIKCAVHLDMPGIPNVTADSTRIDHERRVELHTACASDFFKIDGWVPGAAALPALPAPSPGVPVDYTPAGWAAAQRAKAKQLTGKPKAPKRLQTKPQPKKTKGARS